MRGEDAHGAQIAVALGVVEAVADDEMVGDLEADVAHVHLDLGGLRLAQQGADLDGGGAATDSSGVVRIIKDLEINISGRDVLVVEDIIDSGLTLSYLRRTLGARKPASLEICALLTKPERREVEVPVRYVGFEIPNRFVIGYGLDFAERYRNLPYIGVLHPDLVPNGL